MSRQDACFPLLPRPLVLPLITARAVSSIDPKQTSIVPCEAAVLVFRKKLPLAALRALVHGMEGDLPETEHYRWPERTLLPRKTRRAHNQRAAKTTPCKIERSDSSP